MRKNLYQKNKHLTPCQLQLMALPSAIPRRLTRQFKTFCFKFLSPCFSGSAGTGTKSTKFYSRSVTNMAASKKSSALHRIIEDFQNWHLRDFPEYATMAEVHDFNDQLDDISLNKALDRKSRCEEFLDSLQKMGNESLSSEDQAHYDILHDQLETFIDGYRWRYHSMCNPVNFLENTHVDYETFMINFTPFKKDSDFHSYLKRLQAMPHKIDQQISLMREAIANHTTLHRTSIERVPKQLSEIIDKDVSEHPFSEPLRKHINVIEGESKQKEIQSMLEMAIKEKVTPAFQKLKHFIESEYLPATRPREGVCCLPDGKAFYQACLRWHLSSHMSPDTVHQTGLSEVARLRNSMQGIMKKVDFTGDLAEFFATLKKDTSFYHTRAEDLLDEYKSMIAQRINPKLNLLFHRLPAVDCDVVAMPFDGAGGQYIDAAEDGSRPGVFQVNLTHPTTIARFGMMVLTLHEVNPGHHMQMSHALQMSLPMFRKKLDYRSLYTAPLSFPFYTAFCEGWALYAEDLGIEMGVYATQYELFGKLTEEMFRACRLVVDTGIHWFGWTKQQAIDYMHENCFMSAHEVENEICRYITWPGQACAYKIGQLKIKELRELAEKELGTEFSVKDFHAVVLDAGSVPLILLERIVRDWIKEQKDQTSRH